MGHSPHSIGRQPSCSYLQRIFRHSREKPVDRDNLGEDGIEGAVGKGDKTRPGGGHGALGRSPARRARTSAVARRAGRGREWRPPGRPPAGGNGPSRGRRRDDWRRRRRRAQSPYHQRHPPREHELAEAAKIMLTGERVEHEAPRASGQLSLPIDRAWGGRERVPCERENRRERWRMRACVEQWRGRQGSRTGSRGCHCNKARAPRLFGSIVPCDATERIVSQPPPERVRRVTFELLEVMLAAVRGQWLQHINWRSRAGVASGGAHTASSGRACFHGVRAKAAGAWAAARLLACGHGHARGRPTAS